jgi:hypothetical protein
MECAITCDRVTFVEYDPREYGEVDLPSSLGIPCDNSGVFRVFEQYARGFMVNRWEPVRGEPCFVIADGYLVYARPKTVVQFYADEVLVGTELLGSWSLSDLGSSRYLKIVDDEGKVSSYDRGDGEYLPQPEARVLAPSEIPPYFKYGDLGTVMACFPYRRQDLERLWRSPRFILQFGQLRDSNGVVIAPSYAFMGFCVQEVAGVCSDREHEGYVEYHRRGPISLASMIPEECVASECIEFGLERYERFSARLVSDYPEAHMMMGRFGYEGRGKSGVERRSDGGRRPPCGAGAKEKKKKM